MAAAGEIRVAGRPTPGCGCEAAKAATDPAIAEVVARVLARNERAIARTISEVENTTPRGRALLTALRPHAGHAKVIGITGPPGAGKSTLVGALIAEYHRRGQKVAVVAIDPSSALSGGAVLGDRVRMMRNASGGGAFIRSLGSRGHGGALSRATAEIVDVLDAAGYDRIIVETVGAGQSDVEAAEITGTLAVVCPPGLGDEVQAIKAGLMEVADIFVVSKGDHPMASETERDLTFMLGMRPAGDWMPPVLRVTATKDEGIGALADALDRHAGRQNGGRTGTRLRVRRLIASDAAALVRSRIAADESPAMDRICEAVLDGTLSDREAALGAILLALRDPEPSTGPRPKGAAAPSGKFHHNTSE